MSLISSDKGSQLGSQILGKQGNRNASKQGLSPKGIKEEETESEGESGYYHSANKSQMN